MVKQAKRILREEWLVVDAATGDLLDASDWRTGAEEKGNRWVNSGESKGYRIIHMREVCDE